MRMQKDPSSAGLGSANLAQYVQLLIIRPGVLETFREDEGNIIRLRVQLTPKTRQVLGGTYLPL